MISGIHHTSRTVKDMDRSLAFYSDLLGMRVAIDTEMQGEMLSKEVALEGAHLRLVELTPQDESFYLELLQYFSPDGAPFPDDARCSDIGAHHIALVVDDIHKAYKELSTKGVRFTYPPQEVDSGLFRGHWTVYCYDPDNLIVELWQLAKGES
jgi:catechol 2,3-dioxygenase-like lactoylglutathione lyase family enzyme